jgi:hypothetical protein
MLDCTLCTVFFACHRTCQDVGCQESTFESHANKKVHDHSA